jgi:hypothetical protein
MFAFEWIAAFLFVASSGLLFNSRFRQHTILSVIAGIIALVSTYFLTREIVDESIASYESRHSLETGNQRARATVPAVRRNLPLHIILVFFDYGSVDLTEKGDEVVQYAAKMIALDHKAGLTQCAAIGHVDRAEAAEYGPSDTPPGLVLSLNRSQTVANRLHQLGIQDVEQQGQGEGNVLVARKVLTREPENRFVKISCSAP